MNIDLNNKIAWVCGSTQGIGKAIAMQLASSGASVLLISRNEEKLKAVLTALPVAHAQKHAYLVVDFNTPEEAAEKLTFYHKANPKVDILINNTGGPSAGPILDAKISDLRHAFNNHIVTSHLLSQICISTMKQYKYGRIINIVSTSVREPIRGLGVSNTIRAAMANWAKTLSVEVAPFGITVNNILPGSTQTGRIEAVIKSKMQKENKTEDAVRQEMISAIPIGRFANPEEIAYAVAFLSSPYAAYITGTHLTVDGGKMASQ